MGRPQKYPWAEMMDGQPTVANRREDFPDLTVENFIRMLHQKANKTGCKVQCRSLGDGKVWFQFYAEAS